MSTLRFPHAVFAATLISAVVFPTTFAVSQPQDLASLTSAQAGGGLREALSRGISTSVSETGKPGGFENNPLIKIAMPEKLQSVEKGLRTLGMGAQVDSFEHSMNSAAEQAAPSAEPILMDALTSK